MATGSPQYAHFELHVADICWRARSESLLLRHTPLPMLGQAPQQKPIMIARPVFAQLPIISA
jgi:hypothetical protein